MPRICFYKLATLAKHGNGDRDLKALRWFLTEQRNIVLGNSRSYYSIPAAALTEFHLTSHTGSSSVARLDPNRRKSPSVVGAILHSFSVPSMSDHSYHDCGYHIDQLLHDVVGSLTRSTGIKLTNAVAINSGRRSMLMNSFVNRSALISRNMSVSLYHGAMPCHNQHTGSSRGQQTRSMRQEISVTNLVHRRLLCSAAGNTFQKDSHLFGRFRGFQTLTIASIDAAAASEGSLDSNFSGGERGISGASSDQNIPLEKPLKLLCGSCCLPHPDKEETGGEDAHFICLNEQVIGVADGVGGWADKGIDAGKYSKELMSNAEAAVLEEPASSVDPARVLAKAHAKTKVQGSCTACIIALSDQTLHAINLGDSGFVVIRDGSTVLKSPVQQHGFNFPYQLENGSIGDQPISGEVFEVSVCPGDVIVAGTDGLFDNLYNSDVCGVVVDCVRSGFGPQIAAQKLAALARERALDEKRQTPFATAAQDAGLRYHGGKLDDITVIVSYITGPANGTVSPAKL